MYTIWRDTIASGPVDNEEFADEREAIEYAFTNLPCDDFPYMVLDEEENEYTCFVFQGMVYRAKQALARVGEGE